VAATSCTRTSFAPFCTAISAAAAEPAARSGKARPVSVPIIPLRDSPASTGTPRSVKRDSARSNARLWSSVLPKPKPGSITMRFLSMPLISQAKMRCARKRCTSETTSS
jgi:hypothetical protein